MSHYNYQEQLHAVWDKATKLYAEGQRGSDTYFTPEENAFLKGIGITAQEVYDFAEDFNNSGEPDFATFAMIHHIRRHYFLEVQNGESSGHTIDPSTYPAKTAEVRGIAWLPRIIEKAKAKLRGELDSDTMYGCGGDRKFAQTHDIHLAEFLEIVRDHMDDNKAVVDWVVRRTSVPVS